MRLGPIAGVTIVVPDLGAAMEFYCARLRLVLIERGQIPAARALALGVKGWVGASFASFAIGGAILQLIESAHALARGGSGWTALSLAGSAVRIEPEGCFGPGGEHWQFATARQDSAATTEIHSLTVAVVDSIAAHAFYRGLGLLDASPDVAIGRLQGGQLLRFEPTPSAPGDAPDGGRLGIHLVSFARSDASGRRLRGMDDPTARVLGGAQGEGLELV